MVTAAAARIGPWHAARDRPRVSDEILDNSGRGSWFRWNADRQSSYARRPRCRKRQRQSAMLENQSRPDPNAWRSLTATSHHYLPVVGSGLILIKGTPKPGRAQAHHRQSLG